MAYTSHGHHIPGTSTEDAPDARMRCGGPGICGPCSRQATAFQSTTKPARKKKG